MRNRDQNNGSALAGATELRAFCKGCGYALVGLEGRVCPECGRGFDLGDRRTFARRRPRGWIWRWGRRAGILLFVLLMSAGGGIGWLWWGWHREQETIAQIATLNAKVPFQRITVSLKPIGPDRLSGVLGGRFSYLRDRVNALSLMDVDASEIDRLDLTSLNHVQKLLVIRCGLGEATLTRMGDMATVQDLTVAYGTGKKLGWEFLGKLTRLTSLDLRGPQASDAELKQVSRLKRLKVLHLGSTSITNAGLKNLKGLTALEDLNFDGTAISDAGLDELGGLQSLRLLWVAHTPVTSKAVDKLKLALPQLEIVDQKSLDNKF